MPITEALRARRAPDISVLVPGFADITKSALTVAGALYAALSVLHLFQPADWALPMSATAMGTAVLLLGWRAAFSTPSLPQYVRHRALFAITLLAWLNSALHLWLSGDPIQATNVAIVILAAGIVLIDRTEYAVCVVLCWAAWFIHISATGEQTAVAHYGIHLLEVTVLASAAFAWKHMVLVRNNDLLGREQAAREEAEVNLRRATDADITLRENEERFRMLFALAPVGIALTSMEDGHFLSGNDALFDMMGCREGELSGLPCRDTTPCALDVAELEQFELLHAHGHFGPYEKQFVRKDGTHLPVLLSGRRLIDASGRSIVLSVAQDISARKLFEANLADARDAAQAANVAKSRFLATMSHELRTPLNAILGFSDMIGKETFGPVGIPQYAEYGQIIHESGNHLLSLINDVLDLSKVEAGKMELDPEANDVAEIIAEAVRLAGARHGEGHGPSPQTVAAPELPLLLADRRRLLQMIVNLISNARKFTPDEGSVTVHARMLAAGGIVITVTDTGAGIAPADIPKALEPFTQVDDSKSRRHAGTGMGLPIVKSLVELHGGEFTLESDLGLGTRASLIFPPAATRKRPSAPNVPKALIA